MGKYFVIKLADEVGFVTNDSNESKFLVTPDMIDDALHFDSEEEASIYTNLINPDALWVIGEV